MEDIALVEERLTKYLSLVTRINKILFYLISRYSRSTA